MMGNADRDAKWLVWLIGAAWLVTCPPRSADAQVPQQPEAAAAAPIPVAATADTARELAELKQQVAALKEKQEEAGAADLIAQTGTVSSEVTGEALLHVYGFMDFGLDKWITKQDGLGLVRPSGATTFVFGNLNLYFDAAPVEHLRTMVELRFTLAPHGEETELGPPVGTSYERINTTAFEFSSPSSQSQLRLGGLFIERAWAEYEFLDFLKVQWGLFLNPFGIWNLDHGSPTLIALMLPMFISAQMLPTRLLGVNVYGSWVNGHSELGYAVHVSNGRTPLDYDLTENKALGARLFYANEGSFGRLVLGVSGYAGTYYDAQKRLDPAGAASLGNDHIYTWERTIDYAEQVLGFDLALDLGGFRLRSEAVFRWVKYDGDKTERVVALDGREQYLPSRLEWSTYALAAYRTPWLIEPYLEIEMATKTLVLPRWATPAEATSPNYAILFLSAGFNVQLTTHTLLKFQAVWIRSYERDYTHRGLNDGALFGRVVQSF